MSDQDRPTEAFVPPQPGPPTAPPTAWPAPALDATQVWSPAPWSAPTPDPTPAWAPTPSSPHAAGWPPPAPPAAPPNPYGTWSPPPGPPHGIPTGYGASTYGQPWYEAWPPPPALAPPAPPRRSGPLAVLAVALVALLCVATVIGGAAVVSSGGQGASAEAMGTAPVRGPQPDATDPSAATERLAPAPALPVEDPRHAYILTEGDGDPVAWDPCETIQYVVNSRLAPRGADAILDEAIARISAATGLVFEDVGATDEPPPGEAERPLMDPARYGDGWSPVLISWTDVVEDPDLEGAAGLALPMSQTAASGEEVYVTGYVEMAGDYAADLIDLGRSDDVLGVMMHELGHLVGLDHVDDPTQVMTDDPNSTPVEFGAGDLYALAQAGNGECEPDV